MQSYYEINVSKNGSHFFATAERSAWVENEAAELYAVFSEKFPKSEGYEVSVTLWTAGGCDQSEWIKTLAKEIKEKKDINKNIQFTIKFENDNKNKIVTGMTVENYITKVLGYELINIWPTASGCSGNVRVRVSSKAKEAFGFSVKFKNNKIKIGQ